MDRQARYAKLERSARAGAVARSAAVYALLAAGIVAAGYAHRADGSEQTVIVLGAGLRGDTPSRLLRCRLDAAYDFAAAHPGALVITTGGQGRGETRSEGEVMREYLITKWNY